MLPPQGKLGVTVDTVTLVEGLFEHSYSVIVMLHVYFYPNTFSKSSYVLHVMIMIIDCYPMQVFGLLTNKYDN